MIYYLPKHEVTKLAGSEVLNLPAQEHHAGLGFLPSFHSDILSVGTGSSMDRIWQPPFQASHTNQTQWDSDIPFLHEHLFLSNKTLPDGLLHSLLLKALQL